MHACPWRVITLFIAVREDFGVRADTPSSRPRPLRLGTALSLGVCPLPGLTGKLGAASRGPSQAFREGHRPGQGPKICFE